MTIEYFEEKVLPLKDRLYRHALWILNNPTDAQDAVQECFLRLWKQRNKWQEYRSIEAFSLKIIKNLCIDQLRRTKFVEEIDNNAEKAVDMKTPYMYASHRDSIGLIGRIISTLPVQQRIILQLRNVEDLSMQDIAEITGMRLNTLQVILSRARKKIREEYQKTVNYGGQKNK